MTGRRGGAARTGAAAAALTVALLAAGCGDGSTSTGGTPGSSPGTGSGAASGGAPGAGSGGLTGAGTHEINDSTAHVRYSVPGEWTQSKNLLTYFTSGASTAPAESDPNASAKPKPTASGSEDDQAMFLVGVLDAKMFASQERDTKAAAHALAKQYAEFFYPDDAKDQVKDDHAVKVDGHDGWYTDLECVPDDAKDTPFRFRVTVVTVTGGTPVYTLGVAKSGAGKRLDELDRIGRTLRIG
ncbi:APA family fibronectin-binding glycoprotein [Yinghuangia seranimata]|uniref:APA family fibronectin-binding glycoprotein n=1 Tax=Yinghuangia seranimata TaxID=408067 RepID=UPI00248AC410|nr:hypothetical protein [Yinghuangia seranimata]MDI2128564.1 hypothetical protein [Yinghuangia seranimata]